MIVKIFTLDEDQFLSTFPAGSHVLGRGPVLQCNDKRVSRNHATIEVTQDNVKLTSIHINPCFLKAANGSAVTILPKDTSANLHNGDAFAFLPETFWFKVRIIDSDDDTLISNESNNAKRATSGEVDLPPDKKARVESCNDNEASSSIQANVMEINEKEVEDKNDSNLKAEKEEATTGTETDSPLCDTTTGNLQEATISALNADNEPNVSSNVTEELSDNEAAAKEEPDEPNAGDNLVAANPRLRRERCWYGAQCYRANPVHRRELSHPGDSDYESDPNDTRPSCSYGAACYRKNKDHRRQYKHPARQPLGKKKRTRKKVDRLNAADSEEMRAAFSQESEDPYLTDGSDEYVIDDSEESDSDDFVVSDKSDDE